MKSVRNCFLIFALTIMFTRIARAQFAVVDSANLAEAVKEFKQMQQMYTTAEQTRNQIISTYNLAYQMSRMPENLAARYKADFAQWTNVSAPNTYDNTSAWVNALDIGGRPHAVSAFNSAIVKLLNFPTSALAALDADAQATIKNQYATSELAEGTTESTLSTLGSIRSNSEAFSSRLANLESDSFSTDPGQQSEMAVLGKINTATLLQVHSQQDTNQILAAEVEQQLIAQKQQMDAQNRAINQAIYFQQNFPDMMQKVNTGVSQSMRTISLSPNGQ
jgi:hypothetical protein